MGKRFLNNPLSSAVQVLTQEVESPELLERLKRLEAELAEERAKPPVIQEKTVEITKLVDNPRLLEKLKKLEQAYEDLKAKGAYKLVKDHIPNIQESRPNMEQAATAPAKASTGGVDIKKLGPAFIVGLSIGAAVVWLFMR